MLLIYPPVGDCTIPPLGIAKLVGFMRKFEKQIHILDYNIDALYELLSKENLHKAYLKVCDRIAEIERKYEELSPETQNEYAILFESKLQGNYLEENIEDALHSLKQMKYYRNWNIYSKKATIIKQSMELVANSYYPSKWDFRYLNFHGDTSSKKIINILDNRKENFYLEYFERKISDFEKYSDVYIGISVCYYSQLIPALTLAKLLKNMYPQKKIFLGGSLFSSYIDQWTVFDKFASIIDYIIPFEGEWALLDMENGMDIKLIPDLVYFNGNNFVQNKISEKRKKLFIKPDFSDFELEKYLNPEILLPIEANTACYWGKCNFCYYSTNDTKLFEGDKKEIDEIVEEIAYMNKEYQATSFFFVDECLPPATAFKIASQILQKNLKIHWASEIRFDATFTEEKLRLLRSSGYVMAMLGLESGQERVLKAMNKGTDIQTIRKMLKNCSEVGIHTYAMFFLGFPSETKEEALKTIEFIDENIEYINYYSFGPFILTKNIDIFQNPQRYGVKVYNNDNDLALSVHYDVDVGLSEDETSLLVDQIKAEREEFLKCELISVMHIMYLPKIKVSLKTEERRVKDINKKDYYMKNPNIVYQESKFDILKNSNLKGNYKILYNCSTQDVYLVGKNFIQQFNSISEKQTLERIYNDVLQRNTQIMKILLENELLIPAME